MKIRIFSTLSLILAACSSAFAQVPFSGTYTLVGSGNDVASLNYNGTSVTNLTVSPLIKVGITSTSSSGNFRGNNWALDVAPVGSLTGEIDTTKYIEFTLTAASDYAINLSSLTFGIGRSSSGPRQWQWRSSVDNYAAPLASYTTLASGLTNSSGVLEHSDSTASWVGNVLSTSALGNVTAITLRLYAYNAEQTTGTAGLQGNLTFSGNMVFTGTAAAGTTWTGTGSGATWQNGATGNFDGTYSNNLTNFVTFGGTGEAVTLSGSVQAGDVTISSTGFVFGGSTLELGKGTILTVASTSTTIDSAISGTSGLKKEGPGTLTLTGTNIFSGGLFVNGGTLNISGENQLGDASNSVTLNGGILTTANSLTLGAGRTLAGTGSISLGAGTTFTTNGTVNAGSLTFPGAASIVFAGPSNAATGLTLGSATSVTISGGELALSGNLTASQTSGSTTIVGPISFAGTPTRTLLVAGGTLTPTGGFSTGSYLVKTGAGTLDLTQNTSGTVTGLQIGIAGTTPAGLTIVDQAADLGSGTNQLRLNNGTLQISQPMVVPIGASIGGRDGAEAIITGSNIEFQGNTGFFTGSGTSGVLRFVVNNTTTISGPLTATGTGGGSSTGVSLGGTGKLIITGSGLSLDQLVTLSDTVTLKIANQFGLGRIFVTNGTVLELSDATLAGGITVEAGGIVRCTGVNVINGEVSNSGIIEISGATTTLTINNVVTNSTGAAITVDDDALLVADSGFTNDGVLDLSGANENQTVPAGISGSGTVIPVGVSEPVVPTTTLVFTGGQASVSFASETGHTYLLQRTTDLGTSPIVWTNIGSVTAGTGSTLTLTDSEPPTSAKIFYRVVID